jgi:hypothetical protein
MTIGWGLIFATFLLVLVGCWLYVSDSVGLAQLLWVLASGTAGAGVVLLVEERR